MKMFSALSLAALGAAMTFTNGAFAQIATTDITDAITDGQVAGVAVSLAFGVALWLIKGSKLVRPR